MVLADEKVCMKASSSCGSVDEWILVEESTMP